MDAIKKIIEQDMQELQRIENGEKSSIFKSKEECIQDIKNMKRRLAVLRGENLIVCDTLAELVAQVFQYGDTRNYKIVLHDIDDYRRALVLFFDTPYIAFSYNQEEDA